MFKRVQKANADHEKRVRRGEVDEDEGPRELAMDMDSDSDSSEGSESGSSSSESSSSEDEKPSKTVKDGKAAETGSKKRKLEEEDSYDEDSEEDSEEEDSEEEESSDEGKPVDPVVEALLRPSIKKALDEPIFVKPNAIVRQGYQHRSCHMCSQVLIKTEKMIETHLKSGSHQRKVKRYSKEAELLKPEQLKEPSEGGMNIEQLRERVEKKLAKQLEGQQKVRDHAKQMKLEARRKRAVVKAANRQARKEAKLAKKAVIEASGRPQNGNSLSKKQKTEVDQEKTDTTAAHDDDSMKQLQSKEKKHDIAEDIIQQKLAVLKQTESDPRKLTKKYVKKHLLTPRERDELKKVKNQQKSQLKYEVRQRKREKKAAAAAAKEGSQGNQEE